MALLDVNALVALVWDSHVHHASARRWFTDNSARGWATCPTTEAGFVRVSANPSVMPAPITVDEARLVLAALRGHGQHRFLQNDVSMLDEDLPVITGHRQVTDAQLLTLARRHSISLLTFDAAIRAGAKGRDVVLLSL